MDHPRLLECSGLGKPVKVLIVGEVVQICTEWNKFGERPRKTITDIRYDVPDRVRNIVNMGCDIGHLVKLTK
jgi:hypothetical protein